MPEQVSASASASPSGSVSSTTLPEGWHILSNNVDDFTSSGFGPDQADVRISFEFVSFDYGGTMANDPVLAVKGTCTPLDGANEGKEFVAHWTTGPKMVDVMIMDDGSKVASKAKDNLADNSNWAFFQQSLKDTGVFDTRLLSGPDGIKSANGITLTIKQVERTDQVDKGVTGANGKPKRQKYYTCLKVIALPGQTALKPGRKTSAQAPASAPASGPSAASRAAMNQPAPASNGTSGSHSALEYIKQALDAAGGTIPLTGTDGLQKAVYKLAKAAGASTMEANTMGSQSGDPDFLIEQNMEHDLGWNVADGSLSKA